MQLSLYYATNRNHLGPDRWAPTGYGKSFSADGMENLRFGKLTVDADNAKIKKHLKKSVGKAGKGDGIALGNYLSQSAETAKIRAYEEAINPEFSDISQPKAQFGSKAMFEDLMAEMQYASDMLVYIHGFNVSKESVHQTDRMEVVDSSDNFHRVQLLPYREYQCGCSIEH